MSQLISSDFSSYDALTVDQQEQIQAGQLALYYVPVGQIDPTQLNEGLTEVGKKTAGFDLLTPAQLNPTLLTDIEPVVIGPDGQLYLLDGHHTFTALTDSIYGANTDVFVDVVANYSDLSESQFFTTMQANNLLLPLNDGVPEIVNDATGSPIPTSLPDLTNDPYRGLEYSILKNKSMKLFTTANNITGAIGPSTAGLDKMTGFYEDFFEAAAYRDANGGLGLPYLSPGDIALATQWNLNPLSTTTLPNVTGAVDAGQLPGFILNASIIITGVVSPTTVANGALDGTHTGTFDETTTFASFNGITQLNAGTEANPIIIGTPNVGFILQLGADRTFTVTLSNTSNTYTGGTSLLAGTLIIAGDGSLGAAPTTYTYNQTTVKTDVQADNGIIFNSLTEGNATLQIGTTAGGGTATFSTSRPIAVGGEVAIINLNGYIVSLNGPIVSLGVDGDGIGNATGFSDLTIDDTSANKGILILSTPSPDFFGNLIIGSSKKPTVRVTSDAAMGNTTGAADEIGQVELNGGTFQAGASFTSVRSFFLQSGSTFDTGGFTTSFSGTLSDDDRNLTITTTNLSGTGTGSVTFGSFVIAGGSELTVSKGSGVTSTAVTFTNGISQTAASDQVLLAGLSASTTVGAGTAPALTNGIVAPWIVIDSGASNNPYDFATYGGSGFTAFAGYATDITASTNTSVVKQGVSVALGADAAAYALNLQKGFNITATGHTLTLGDGTEAGLIFNGGSSSGLTGGTLAFGTAAAYVTINGSSTVSSAITGSGGLNLAGTGTLTVSAVSSESGLVTVNSGSLALSATNVFSSDAAGLLLQDSKNLAVANLTLNNSNQFAALGSAGNNSTITINNGAALTIGDTTNNLSSTISSTITESTTSATGALTFDGSGLFDLSGGKITLLSGSSIIVNNSAQLRVAASIFNASNYGIVLNGTSQLQFAQSGGGQFANAISGTGEVHLIGGTLDLTGLSNTYSGGTVIETGSTLDLTPGSLSTNNENITDAGGLVVFDQSNSQSGVYTGVISDGLEMGTGPMLSGSLDKDDSTNDNASTSNLQIQNAQTYTGATNVEAGTLTLLVTNAITDSSGITLGRVGGAVDSQTASLVLQAANQVKTLSDNASNTTSVVLNGFALTIDPASGSSATFHGTISDGTPAGGSIVKAGAGTETLSGTNTYTGATTVEGGTLLVTGSIQQSATEVQSGGTLGGTGTSGAVIVDSGGTIEGGTLGGTGSLSVASSLTLSTGATYLETINGSNASSVSVTGMTTLGGATVSIAAGSTVVAGTVYTILSDFGGPPVGTFSATPISYNGMTGTLSYVGSNVDLTFVMNGPVVTAAATASFTGGSNPVALDPGLSVTDPTNSTISSATVSIGQGFLGGDTLNFASQNGITGNYNSDTGVLSLSGTASVADYQSALDSVTYGFSPLDGDPTNGGDDPSRTITWVVNDGANSNSAVTSTLDVESRNTALAPSTTDVMVMGRADGSYEILDLGQNAILSGYQLGQIPTSFQVAGLGDFSSNPGEADIMTRDGSTGAFELYDVNNNNITGSFAMGQVGLEWSAAGFADFGGNANETDMLLRNTTGAFEVYDIAGNSYSGFHSLGQVGPEWSVAGFGDFSGNAKETDMLMRNSNTGAFELYDIVNNNYTGFFSMGQVGPEWTVAGFGDFSGNANETDMLMRNSNTGAFELYDIANNQLTGFHAIGQVGPEWTVAGFGDFSGNANETDMLMRDSNTGAFELYDISNNQLTGFHAIGQIGAEWTVAGIASDPPASAPLAQGADPTGSTALLVQAMTSFGANGAAGSSPAGTATSDPAQQTVLTTPQHA
jgi:autotransporter-associated beta strand protein